MGERPSDRKPTWLDELEHTADTGICVTATSLPELFTRAAWGMFWLITDPKAVEPREEETVAVEAADRDALLVRWLSTLNYRHVTQYRLYSRFEMRDFDPRRLRATIRGERTDRQRHAVNTEIKAVTYHGLSIEEVGGVWQARIIFDL